MLLVCPTVCRTLLPGERLPCLFGKECGGTDVWSLCGNGRRRAGRGIFLLFHSNRNQYGVFKICPCGCLKAGKGVGKEMLRLARSTRLTAPERIRSNCMCLLKTAPPSGAMRQSGSWKRVWTKKPSLIRIKCGADAEWCFSDKTFRVRAGRSPSDPAGRTEPEALKERTRTVARLWSPQVSAVKQRRNQADIQTPRGLPLTAVRGEFCAEIKKSGSIF